MSLSLPTISAIQEDVTMRWLSLGLCLPLFLLGFWALFKPRRYQEILIRLTARLPDQKAAAPTIRFLKGRYFIAFLRLWSLIAIGMGLAILCNVV